MHCESPCGLPQLSRCSSHLQKHSKFKRFPAPHLVGQLLPSWFAPKKWKFPLVGSRDLLKRLAIYIYIYGFVLVDWMQNKWYQNWFEDILPENRNKLWPPHAHITYHITPKDEVPTTWHMSKINILHWYDLNSCWCRIILQVSRHMLLSNQLSSCFISNIPQPNTQKRSRGAARFSVKHPLIEGGL